MLKLTVSIISSLIIAIIAVFLFAEPLAENQIHILKTLAIICIVIIFLCFILSEITNNYSQTDKLWSISPIIYTWTISYMTAFDHRIVLMSILITFWGIRLTYNFNKMGGYSWKFWTGHEDYRWKILRAKPGMNKPVIWHLFNLLFIAGYQNILILLITLPVLASYTDAKHSLNYIDLIISAVIIALIIFETIADEQQRTFQKEKKRINESGETLPEDLAKGFVHKGLWGISRHPNYFAEQSIWVMIFLFSVNATGNWGNFSIIGCLLLIILFQGSSFFSEQISSAKYPAYKDYTKKVGKFFPKITFNKNKSDK